MTIPFYIKRSETCSGSDVDRLVIDDPDEYQNAVELATRFAPKLKQDIVLHDGEISIFDAFKLEDEIDRLSRRQVYLRSGGYLVIDETEALCTIDVNSGKFTSGSNLSETILRLNLEAAEEVARQVRLRDLGGIIIIDFVDMDNASHRSQLARVLERAMKNDRARAKISSISQLGLVQMTRKRTGESVVEQLAEKCPYCAGKGRILGHETVSLDIERELQRKCKSEHPEAILVTAHPKVAELLIGPEGENIEDLERLLHCAIYVRADLNMHSEKYDIQCGTMADYDRAWLGYRRGQIVEADVYESVLQSGDELSLVGWSEGFLLEITEGQCAAGQRVRARLIEVRRSFAMVEVIPSARPVVAHRMHV